jgi:hypothetical protein
MKSPKLVLVISLWLIGFQLSLAQEKAKLIDEFGATICDDLQTRLNNLSQQFAKSPNSKIYIVIYGEKHPPVAKYRYEVLLMAYWEFLRFPPERLKILHGNDEERERTQI